MADGSIPHPALERMELRRQMVAAVDRMLTAVDLLIAELDGDAGDADLEPSLGAPEVVGGLHSRAHAQAVDQRRWARGAHDDREEPEGEDEPSLGSLGGTAENRRGGQRVWSGGGTDDLEEACEDEGGACEDEGADNGDREPDPDAMCNWADEGDQTALKALPVYVKRRRRGGPSPAPYAKPPVRG